MLRKLVCSIMCVLAVWGCNVDREVEPQVAPRVSFDSEDGVYTVRTGREVHIAARVEGGGSNMRYSWYCSGKELGRGEELNTVFDVPGCYYVSLVVDWDGGEAEWEVRVDVLDPAPVKIDFPVVGADNRLQVKVGEEVSLCPEYLNGYTEEFNVTWTVDGEEMSCGPQLDFIPAHMGEYHVKVTAGNDDGADSLEFVLEGVERLPVKVWFGAGSSAVPCDVKYVGEGEEIVLAPYAWGVEAHDVWKWTVDGVPQGVDSQVLAFSPSAPGSYVVGVKVGGVSAEVRVECVDYARMGKFRGADSGSKPSVTKVWDYMPAPGQFIGDGAGDAGMGPDVCDSESASAWAQTRLASGGYVSLGAFGGYVICGFDHSVRNGSATDGNADIYVWGNAFDSSNEPGCVWVSRDTNGNGVPDDEWYELRGSEHENPLTYKNYTVEYYKPGCDGVGVMWRDCHGTIGTVRYIGASHSQPSYWPVWTRGGVLMTGGTRLPDNAQMNPVTGQWFSNAYGWGYADNVGTDSFIMKHPGGAATQCVGLRISNAVRADGSAARLEYVDFVMVKSGQLQHVGQLGESSTEVCGISDARM